MPQKVYFPNTNGILKIMVTVYVLVLLAGTIINVIKREGLENWLTFITISSIYIIVCSLIYVAIKSQRIILTDKSFTLKQLGLIRHRISLKEIEEVRKGKMDGSPIMEIETRINGLKKVSPVPFLPFEKDWKEMLQLLEGNCGEEIIGEMTLTRQKGELRTWIDQ
jgi:hypothetical protein